MTMCRGSEDAIVVAACRRRRVRALQLGATKPPGFGHALCCGSELG